MVTVDFPVSSSSLTPPSPPPTDPWGCPGRVSDFFVIIVLASCKNRCHIDYMIEQYIWHAEFLFLGYGTDFQNRLASGNIWERCIYSSKTQWRFGIWRVLKFLLFIGLYCFISKTKLTQRQILSKALFFLENPLIAFLNHFVASPWRKDGYLEHLSDSCMMNWQES